MQQYYFEMLDRPVKAKDAASIVYQDPDKAIVERFCSVNALESKDMLYPGYFLVTPSLNAAGSAGRVPEIAAEANYRSRNAITNADPSLFNKGFGVLEGITRTDATKIGKDQFGGIADYMDARIKLLTKDFKSLESVYKDAYTKKIPFSSEQFRQMSKGLQSSIRDQLQGLQIKEITKQAKPPNPKDLLGLKHRSIANSFRTNGGAGEVKAISKAIERTGTAAKAAKHVGTIGKVLSIAATVDEVKKGFKAGTAQGMGTMGREAAGLAGGFAAGAAGASAATAAMVALGVGTGGLGFVVIGLGAVSVGLIASEAGEGLAKDTYDGATVLLNSAAEKAIDIFVR